MHHEVLLAVLGFPGDVIVQTKDGLEVAEDLPFLTPAEREATNRVVRLGWFYMHLRDFVDRYRFAGTFASPDEEVGAGGVPGLPIAVQERILGPPASGALQQQGSLYVQAFCVGVDEVLARYESDVADLESEVIQDVHLPTSYLQHRLANYQALLPALHGLAQRIVSGGGGGCHATTTTKGYYYSCRGARVVEALYEESKSGNTQVRRVMEGILRRVQGVFLHQMKLWTLHGILCDPFEEFFVRIKATATTASSTSTTGRGGNGAGGKGGDDDDAEYEWKSKHELRREAAPLLFFPAPLAARVFFLGRAVRVLDKTTGINKKNKKQHGNTSAKSGGAMREDEVLSFSKRWDSLLLTTSSNSVGGKGGGEVLDVLALQVIIDDVYKVVAGRLWSLLMEDKGLPWHMQVIRDLFLLGRGAIFQALIEDNRHTLLKAPSPSAEMDLSMAFTNLLSTDNHHTQDNTHDDDHHQAPPHLSTAGTNGSLVAKLCYLVVNPPTFSATDFHNYAPSIFRLAGDASFLPGSGTLRLGHRGAGAWSRARKAVKWGGAGGGGLCTSFSLRRIATTSEQQPGKEGVLSLVLHNDAVPPQVVAEGIQHSITVQLRLPSPSPPTGRTVLGERTMATGLLVGTASRELTVDCTSKGKGKGWVLRVFVDDAERKAAPLLAVDLDHHKAPSQHSSASLPRDGEDDDDDGPGGLGGGGQGVYIGLVSQGCGFDVHTWSLGPSNSTSSAGSPSSSLCPQLMRGAQTTMEAQDLWARGTTLQLEYRVGWPLQLVLTQESLTCYNHIFNFLFQLRRVSNELERLWPIMTRFWRDRMGQDRGLMMAVMALRARMAYVIDNLIYYMQVDVIDSRYTALQSDLSSTHDFDALVRLHRSFYLGLQARAFLVPSMAPVQAVVHSLLALARRFTALADQSLTNHHHDSDSSSSTAATTADADGSRGSISSSSSNRTLLDDDEYRRALHREVCCLQQALSDKTAALKRLLERSEGKELALRLVDDDQQDDDEVQQHGTANANN